VAVIDADEATRSFRWRTFRIVFALTCAAIVLDLWTTYMGFEREGPRFEQNGIVLYLLEHVGWLGVAGILAVACFACFRSFKSVYWNLGLRWSFWLNMFLIAACGFRWLVVATATLWLMH